MLMAQGGREGERRLMTQGRREKKKGDWDNCRKKGRRERRRDST